MKIVIGGDFSTYGKKVDVEPFSSEVIQLFKSADVSVVNLESPIADNGDCPIKKAGPNIMMPSSSVQYLKDCGINLVTLANNHFLDYGEIGVNKTISFLSQLGFSYVGGGRTGDEIRKVCEIGNDIVILNYCESEFSVSKEVGSNPLDLIKVYSDVKKTIETGKFVVVIVHGGHETYNLPSPRMQETYRFFIDLGVKVVVNHHQHCYSGFESYHNGYIFYGLGNLFFPPISKKCKPSWFTGYLLELIVSPEKNVNFKLHPYTQSIQPVSSVTLMDSSQKDTFNNDIEKLNSVISSPELIKHSFDSYVNKSLRYSILTKLSPYTGKLMLALCRRGFLPFLMGESRRLRILNLIRCESHRDACIQILS